jgi:hypothetical protein
VRKPNPPPAKHKCLLASMLKQHGPAGTKRMLQGSKILAWSVLSRSKVCDECASILHKLFPDGDIPYIDPFKGIDPGITHDLQEVGFADHNPGPKGPRPSA